jgi:beta-glucosidase
VEAVDSASLAVRVRVHNTGGRTGRHVVQVYASRPGSAIQRAARWLVGFAAVELAAGQADDVEVPVPLAALRHWDSAAHGWQLEPGRFELHVGHQVEDLPLTVTLDL